jgi:spore germination protein
LQTFLAYLLTIILSLAGIFGGGTPSSPQSTGLAPGQGAIIQGEGALLREGPGVDYPVVDTIPKGQRVQIVETRNGWYYITTPESEGWIAAWLLRADGSTPYLSTNKARQMVGYYVEDGRGASYAALTEHSHLIDTVAIWSYMLDDQGELQGQSTARVLDHAGQANIKTLALIHNYREPAFDATMITELLSNPQNRRRAVENIYNTLTRWGYSGVNIDLENVPAEQRDNLTAFMAELAARLRPANLLVTMSVPAKTGKHNWHAAYDYRALAPHVDQMMLMTYDEHYRDGPPGPIASIGWVEDVIQYATKHIPREKLFLGIAGYGYNWEERGPDQWQAAALTEKQARTLAQTKNVPIQWDEQAKVSYFTYTDVGRRHQVYFEDSYSLAHKLFLVNKYDLAGIALWRLSYESPAFWETAARGLKP